jgi:hypothetical protein
VTLVPSLDLNRLRGIVARSYQAITVLKVWGLLTILARAPAHANLFRTCTG